MCVQCTARESYFKLPLRLFFLYCSSEYSAFWRCVKAGAAYLVTQLCKVNCCATLIANELNEITTGLVVNNSEDP